MTVNADTIREDVSFGTDDDYGIDDAAAAFLARTTGDETKRKLTPSTETQAEATEDAQEETGADTEENTEEAPEATGDPDPDDAEIEIKVGEETKKATLKDLKRLYGQEASLTQKSQKLAEAAKAAEANNTRAMTALNALIGKAVERHKPYAEMDWLVLSQRMNTEDFQALRADAAAAEADLKFLNSELDQTVQQQRTSAQAAHRAQAQECIKALSDPTQGIKGWSEPLYVEMMDFAKSNGLPEAANFVKPEAIKILHMAMLYAKGQTAASTAQAKAEKAVHQATRVLKPTTNRNSTTSTASSGERDAMRALKQSGSVDDAAALFYARARKN